MCGVRVAAVMLILGTSYYPELSPHFWTLSPLVSCRAQNLYSHLYNNAINHYFSTRGGSL